jgi:hypothetical protein
LISAAIFTDFIGIDTLTSYSADQEVINYRKAVNNFKKLRYSIKIAQLKNV